MKLRPVLSASAMALLIAAACTHPALATEDTASPEVKVSESPTAPSPDAEDEPTPSPTATPESASAEEPEETTETDEEDEDDVETQSPPVIEYLLEATAAPVTRPSVQAAPPSPVTPEAPATVETFNSPMVEADGGSNASSNNRAQAEASNQPMAANPQNSGRASGEVSNSTNSNGSSARTNRSNSGAASQAPIVSPLSLPITSVQNVPFFGADALAQALLNAQDPDDDAPVEEITTGTSEAPGRIESRRLVQPNQTTDAAPQDSASESQAPPSTPQETRSAPEQDIRSAPQEDHLVTTGARSTSLAIGGVLLIAAGIALLSWRRRTSE